MTVLCADRDGERFLFFNCLQESNGKFLSYKSRVDPYLETREREEQFVQQIVSAVEKSMEKALPVFLAGCMAGLSKSNAAVPPAESPATDPDADVDWDFLGE